MSNLVVPVPRAKVTEQFKMLDSYIIVANSVTKGFTVTPSTLKQAEECLYMAKGIVQCLERFGMIESPYRVKADLERIEEKINELKSER